MRPRFFLAHGLAYELAYELAYKLAYELAYKLAYGLAYKLAIVKKRRMKIPQLLINCLLIAVSVEVVHHCFVDVAIDVVIK
jgi:uncharacterized membrane protein